MPCICVEEQFCCIPGEHKAENRFCLAVRENNASETGRKARRVVSAQPQSLEDRMGLVKYGTNRKEDNTSTITN